MKTELKRLRAQVKALPVKAADREALCERIKQLASTFNAMTNEERAAWDAAHPITPELQALSDRIEALAAQQRSRESPAESGVA